LTINTAKKKTAIQHSSKHNIDFQSLFIFFFHSLFFLMVSQ